MESVKNYYNYDTSSLEGEVWVDIPEYAGYYMVSNFARVKSVDRFVDNKRFGKVFKKSQILSPGRNSDGYLIVVLKKDSKSKTISLHKIVAMCFVQNEFLYNEVNHIDGNKQNNLPSNLEWCTRKQNMTHSVLSKLRDYSKPFDCSKFRLTEQEILFIFNSKEDTILLANRFNLTKSSIQRIRSGKTYSKVTNGGKSILDAYRKLTQELADEIRNSQLTQKEIVEKYGVSKGLVYNIKNNLSYKKELNGHDRR